MTAICDWQGKFDRPCAQPHWRTFDPLRIKLTNVQSVTQSESPPGPAVTLGSHWYHCRSLADCMPSRCVTLRNARCSFPTVALSRCTVSCTQTTAGFIGRREFEYGCAVAKQGPHEGRPQRALSPVLRQSRPECRARGCRGARRRSHGRVVWCGPHPPRSEPRLSLTASQRQLSAQAVATV